MAAVLGSCTAPYADRVVLRPPRALRRCPHVEERSREGNQAEVFAYIQANHFLPDNVVDIFWGDYSITCVEEDGLCRVQREEIVGTSFIKLHVEAIS